MLKFKTLFLKYIKGPNHFGKLRIVNFLLEKTFPILEAQTESGKMLLNSCDLIQRAALLTGKFEKDVFDLHKKILKQGDTYVDIGANCGVFTLLASKLIGCKGKAIAIEPNPEINAQLQVNKKLNKSAKNITIYCCALGSKNEIKYFHIPPKENSGLARFTDSKKKGDHISVGVFKLSDILKREKAKKINLLKIDTEGSEMPIFLNLFKQKIFPSNIIFEYLPNVFKTHKKIIYLLEKNKYKIFTTSGDQIKDKECFNIWAILKK